MTKVQKVGMCTECFELFPCVIQYDHNSFNMHFDPPNNTIHAYDPGMLIGRVLFTHACPTDQYGEKHDIVILDQKIAEYIAKFNKLGYYTLYSCDGHCNDPSDQIGCLCSYVLFDGSISKAKKINLYSAYKYAMNHVTDTCTVLEGSSDESEPFKSVEKSTYIGNQTRICISIDAELALNHDDFFENFEVYQDRFMSLLYYMIAYLED